MSRRWLDHALGASGLQPATSFPRDLVADVAMQLPLSIEMLPGLSSHAVDQWLFRRGIEYRIKDIDRRLHGCLLARAGYGIVFLDACDGEEERRFSLAHETAHFVLDHLLPRLHALKVFGERILPALDGKRAPTREETLSAALERVQLGVQVHLMSRSPKGAICTWDVEESERRADRLALELLAPGNTVMSGLKKVMAMLVATGSRADRAVQYLADGFGLPADVAASYVQLLFSDRRRSRSLTEEIFGRE